MRYLNVFLVAAALAMPATAAKAQAVSGLYMGGSAGVNFIDREGFDATVAGAPTPAGTGSFSAGPVILVSVGWGFGNGVRAELEGSWRGNDLSRSSLGGISGSADEQKFGAMVNVYYDFVGVIPVVQPYIGAGIGYQSAQLNVHVPGIAFSTTPVGSFAYQAMAGAALPIQAVPGLSLTAEYRYMGLAGNRGYSGTGAGVVPFSLISSSNDNHSLLVGVRYVFGGPR